MVDTGILSNNMTFPSHKCWMTFCDLTIYNDNPYWSDFVPNSTFYRILSGFHRTFATVVACWQGTLTSSGHLVPSLWDLHMFYLLRPILFRTCRYFTGLCSSNIPRYFLDFVFHVLSNISHTFVTENYFVVDGRDPGRSFPTRCNKISKVFLRLKSMIVVKCHVSATLDFNYSLCDIYQIAELSSYSHLAVL